MLHAREDYQRIQDPLGKIGEDEPVFLVRAKDVLAPMVMRQWAMLHRIQGGDSAMSDSVEKHANLTEKWQREYGCKVADL